MKWTVLFETHDGSTHPLRLEYPHPVDATRVREYAGKYMREGNHGLHLVCITDVYQTPLREFDRNGKPMHTESHPLPVVPPRTTPKSVTARMRASGIRSLAGFEIVKKLMELQAESPNDYGVTQTYLARHTNITTAAATGLLNSLASRGWITRNPKPGDNRVNIIKLGASV